MEIIRDWEPQNCVRCRTDRGTAAFVITGSLLFLAPLVLTVDQDKTERWKDLCKQTETEQDPAKLLALVQEIERLLDAQRERQRKNRLQTRDSDG
jgi:hypothetical protein